MFSSYVSSTDDFSDEITGGDSLNMETVVQLYDDDAMEHIMNFGSVAMVYEVYRDFYPYASGVYVKSNAINNTFSGRHAVKVVGWGSEVGADGVDRDYWEG